MGFSRQENWSGLPCPPPGDLLDSGTELTSLVSSALVDRLVTTESPIYSQTILNKVCILNILYILNIQRIIQQIHPYTHMLFINYRHLSLDTSALELRVAIFSFLKK